jgi:hypothetical protein
MSFVRARVRVLSFLFHDLHVAKAGGLTQSNAKPAKTSFARFHVHRSMVHELRGARGSGCETPATYAFSPSSPPSLANARKPRSSV